MHYKSIGLTLAILSLASPTIYAETNQTILDGGRLFFTHANVARNDTIDEFGNLRNAFYINKAGNLSSLIGKNGLSEFAFDTLLAEGGNGDSNWNNNGTKIFTRLNNLTFDESGLIKREALLRNSRELNQKVTN
ncbi:MAG: hypothetical protein ACRCRU_00960 [Vibrio sp.]|uniref:hypothetical protein n=1 Tax=Vibrio sp. TaxID=678 RepID=UPI003F3E152E